MSHEETPVFLEEPAKEEPVKPTKLEPAELLQMKNHTLQMQNLQLQLQVMQQEVQKVVDAQRRVQKEAYDFAASLQRKYGVDFTKVNVQEDGSWAPLPPGLAGMMK